MVADLGRRAVGDLGVMVLIAPGARHLIWAVMPRVGERWLRTWSKGGSADDLFPPVSIEVT